MLLASADWWRMSFGLLGGFNLTHYLSASMQFGDTDTDVLKYLNNTQFAVAAGLQIKFAVGRFTDIFVSLVGARCLTTFSETMNPRTTSTAPCTDRRAFPNLLRVNPQSEILNHIKKRAANRSRPFSVMRC